MRQEYLLLYDISNTRNRTKLFNSLKDVGMHSIQKSVFWGLLNYAEYNMIVRLVESIFDKELDKILFVQTKLRSVKTFRSWGYSESDFMEPHAYII